MPREARQNNGLFHRQTVSAEGYPSGQRGQTVNLLAYAFGGSNPPPSTISMHRDGEWQRSVQGEQVRRWFEPPRVRVRQASRSEA